MALFVSLTLPARAQELFPGGAQSWQPTNPNTQQTGDSASTAVLVDGERSAVVSEVQSPTLDQAAAQLSRVLNSPGYLENLDLSQGAVVVTVDSTEAAEALAKKIPKSLWKRVVLFPVGRLAHALGLKTVLSDYGQWADVKEAQQKVKSGLKAERDNVVSHGWKYGLVSTIRVLGGPIVWLSLHEYPMEVRLVNSVLSAILAYAWSYHESFVIRGVNAYIKRAENRSLEESLTLNPIEKFSLAYPKTTRFAGSVLWGTMTTSVFAAIASWDQIIVHLNHPQFWQAMTAASLSFWKASKLAAVGTAAWQGWNSMDVTKLSQRDNHLITKKQYENYGLFRNVQSIAMGILTPYLFSILFPSQPGLPLNGLQIGAATLFGLNGLAGYAVHVHPKKLLTQLRVNAVVLASFGRDWWDSLTKIISAEQRRMDRPFDEMLALQEPSTPVAIRCEMAMSQNL